MINVDKVLSNIPNFDTFCSVKKLNALVEDLKNDSRFTIKVAGHSDGKEPIYDVRFGSGSVKALIVGYPHIDEPVGGVTIYGLLTLLRDKAADLHNQDIEWHIVPCIDPDGAILNEGWTQKPFTFKSYMNYFHKQNLEGQVDGSFPIDYKKLAYNKPTTSAKVLQSLMDAVKPDFFFSLHNTMVGGAHYYLSHDISKTCYTKIYDLLNDNDMPLHIGSPSYEYLKEYSRGFFELISTRKLYDNLELSTSSPDKYLQCGATSMEYLEYIKPGALSFVAEFGYVKHPSLLNESLTSESYRQLVLRAYADKQFMKTVIIEKWDELESDLNVSSPFYEKVQPHMESAKNNLHEFIPEAPHLSVKELLFNKRYQGVAREDQRFNVYMRDLYRFLTQNYAFVRLLKDSRETPAIKSAIEELDRCFDKWLSDIFGHIDIDKVEIIDVNTLCKVQMGSGLIALNSLLNS